MRLTLRNFLLLLKELALLPHKRRDKMSRRLWYIFGLLRSRSLSRHPERRDETRSNVERRPAKPDDPATVISASQVPPSSTPINANDTPTVRVRGPTIDDTLQQSHENNGAHGLDIDHTSQNQGGPTSNSPATISPNHSGPPSRHCSPSQSPYFSPSYLNGAEAADRGYLNVSPSPAPPSSAQSTSSLSCPLDGGSGSIAPLRTPPIPDTPRHRIRLRPMIKIDRYKKHQKGKLGRAGKKLVLHPVTTEFAP